MTSQEYPHDTKSDKPMTGPDILLYRLTQAESKLSEQDAELKALQKKVEMYERRHEEQEKKRLLWGIGALGSVVMTLGSVIWTYRAVIFK